MSASVDHSGSPHEWQDEAPSRDERSGNHMPPPAFPPGRRRVQFRRHMEQADASRPGEGDLDEALISPDDPWPARAGALEGAFISPEDPIPERTSSSPESELEAEADEGVVTGIGSDAHVHPDELAHGGDPYVQEVTDAVRKLAASLQQKGEAGLKTKTDMSRLEAQLRSYCVGYLAGRRVQDQER